MNPFFMATPWAALVAGLVTGVHCVGMCGPLVCAAAGTEPDRRGMLVYHLGRLISYGLLGGLGGLMGSTLIPFVSSPAWRLLPVAFALFFLAVACGWDKRIRPPALLTRVSSGLHRQALSWPRWWSVGLLGLGTPFLPCAPLYMALGVSLFAGSWGAGALLMVCFALGTIPALVLLQWNWHLWRARLSPTTLRQWQRGLAVVAVVLVVWRGWFGASWEMPSHCPLCH